MRTIDFIVKESFRRSRRSIAAVLLIVLGISIFVASQTINRALNDRTKEQLLRFGANIIVQPKGEPFDLYSGTTRSGLLLPESYVQDVWRIEHSKMLIAVSPKLYERFEVGGRSLLVVGITPDERKAKPWWMIGNEVITDEFPIGREILLGHFAANYLAEEVSEIDLGGETYRVNGVLDETGSPDDFMAFLPLETLQNMVNKWGMVNLIEVSTSCIACKAMDIYGVAEDIDRVLPPDAEVMAVKQIAEAQMGTLKKVMGLTTIIYLVVLILCVVLLMNYLSATVDERRSEIGMLLAMGMDPRKIQMIFVSKVLIFAGAGGLLGFLIGSGVSMALGPLVAETTISPVTSVLPISLGISMGIGFVSSLMPAKRISNLDPVEALRGV